MKWFLFILCCLPVLAIAGDNTCVGNSCNKDVDYIFHEHDVDILENEFINKIKNVGEGGYAEQEQTQKQKQKQKQIQRSEQNSTQETILESEQSTDQANEQETIISQHYEARDPEAHTAHAAKPIGTDCSLSVTGGAQFTFFGFSFADVEESENCVALRTANYFDQKAKYYFSLGTKEGNALGILWHRASINILCVDKDYSRKAFKHMDSEFFACPKEEKIVKVKSEYPPYER